MLECCVIVRFVALKYNLPLSASADNCGARFINAYTAAALLLAHIGIIWASYC